MEDYVDLWDNFSIKFNEKLVYECNGDWSKLDEREQEIAALWKLIADVYNGGFIQFFCNWGFDCFVYALRGIKRVGCAEAYNILNYTYSSVLDKFREDERLEAYWDIPEYLTEEDDNILMETDTAFWEGVGEKLCKAAYEFYCNA